MKTLTLVALAVGLCLLPVRSESQARPALTPEDVKQINELTEAFAKGILAKEWKTVSAHLRRQRRPVSTRRDGRQRTHIDPGVSGWPARDDRLHHAHDLSRRALTISGTHKGLTR